MSALPSSYCPLVIATALSVIAVGCGLGARSGEDEQGTGSDEIRAGEADPGHAAVGMIRLRKGDREGDDESFCSATLVAPDIVLTAAHCVAGRYQAIGFYVGAGQSVPKASSAEAIATMRKYEARAQAAYPGYATGACPSLVPDVGLVKLAAPVTDLKPETIAFREPNVDEVCTMVGFGRHPGADAGTTYQAKRQATGKMIEARPTGFAFEDVTGGTEGGDSGGPLLCGGNVVAVNSCDSHPDWFARLDAAKPWIGAMMTTWDSEAAAALALNQP